MLKTQMQHIISKYLCGEASEEEINNLIIWLEDKNNQQLFEEYLKVNHLLNVTLKSFNSEKAFENKKMFKIRSLNYAHIFKYAAAILMFFSLSYFLVKENKNQVVNPKIVNNGIKPGTDKATLTLEDGKTIALNKGEEYIANNIKSNGKELIYANTNKKNKTIAYNYLTIPRGGQFNIKLSDGTRVWLNSESKLKYPRSFIDGQLREVELIYGEAYFDVSPSTEHDGTLFNVKSQSQNIQVLGTEFNVKAYRDENNIYTTLVEGSVAVNTELEKYMIVPGEQCTMDLTTNKVSIGSVEIRPEISWKNGVYIFRNTALKDIMKTLSRWYDVDVIFKDETLETIPFTGSLNRSSNIVDIINDIKNFGIIKNYKINNKTIILN